MNYLAKIEIVTVDPRSGKEKKHSEEYLVEAVSVTDAEARVVKHFEGFTSIDYTVKSVRETKIVEFLK